MTRVLVLIACAALPGCPGQDASPSQGGGMQAGAGSAATASDTRLCDAHLRWDQRCAALEPEPRQEPYWGQTECLSGPWRHFQPAYLDAAVECFDALDCDASDDACSAAGLAALGIDDEADLAGDALLTRCQTLAASCDALGEDNCLAFAVYVPASREAAERCLELACDAIEDCLQDPP